ncbi:hypothetical protein [Sphingobium yanoikuyae]|uniref:hypothetical protein n=1 Tax=Sphingobium yanoikuyae TaxID=13690 RepID=UPI003F0FFF15
MTAKMDLAASRNVAWRPTIDLFYRGEDLPVAGASVRMQIRLYPGAPAALVTMDAIPFEDMAPTGDKPRRLRLTPAIEQVTLAGLPTGQNAPEPGEADNFAYDIVITYADGAQDKLALGNFLLEPGVTRP